MKAFGVSLLALTLTMNVALAEDVNIFQAARGGNLAEINQYMESDHSLDVKDVKGSTPLIIAAYNGQLDAVKLLLSNGANACQPDAQGQTALMGVSFKGYQEIAVLLAEKCDVNAQSHAGQTALMFASLFGRTSVAEFLLSKGAKKELTDIQGNTAETLAKTQGNQAMVDLLNGKAKDTNVSVKHVR